MAFYKHYIIPFMSLRQGTSYTVNVYKDGAPSGGVKTVDGAADPFTTEEDDDEDIFTPMRTQSGTLRIISTDDLDWRSMMPQNTFDTPVTLTAGSTVVWQGFVNPESFGNTLYGGPAQETEIEVQCPLAALDSEMVDTGMTQVTNFAYLIKTVIDTIGIKTGGTNATNGIVGFDTVVVGGGEYARNWLMKRFDWQNFYTTDSDGATKAKYSLKSILEDMCRFWGWTARTMGRTLYLTNADVVNDEERLLTLSYAQLSTLASGTSAGTVSARQATTSLDGDIYVSTDNEDRQIQGAPRAIVSTDCNPQKSVMEFAPKVVEDILEKDSPWKWEQGNEDLTGYFTTPTKQSFSSDIMTGTSAGGYNGFCRRQIFSSTEAESAEKSDMILMDDTYDGSTPLAQLTLLRSHNYSNGSLSINGRLYQGYKEMQADNPGTWFLWIRLGIGASRSTAKWYKLTCDHNGHIFSSWESSPQLLALKVNGSTIAGFAAWGITPTWNTLIEWGMFKSIPVDGGLKGQLFIDFMGMRSIDRGTTVGDLAAFEVEFSRDVTYIQSDTEARRSRTMEDERISEKEYTSTNNGQGEGEWSTDCIFASDNNMQYGLGLVMNEADDSFMQTAQYPSAYEHPEQHLADRVTRYWSQPRRCLNVEVTSYSARDINPLRPVYIDETMMHPTAISHSWQDDTTQLTLLQIW